MEKILVPVDFSESSRLILDQVIKIAKDSKAKIYLMHVASLDLGFVIGDMGYQYIPELEQNGLEIETKELGDMEKELKDAGINVEILIKQGIPSDIILETIKELDIDIIVMGSHGRGFIMGAILGSVSKNVIKNSKIPVLLVPVSDK